MDIMNITFTPIPTKTVEYDTSSLYLILGITFMILLSVIAVKVMCFCQAFQKNNIEPQIAIPVIIEIPMAISISNQTVEEEYMGTVI